MEETTGEHNENGGSTIITNFGYRNDGIESTSSATKASDTCLLQNVHMDVIISSHPETSLLNVIAADNVLKGSLLNCSSVGVLGISNTLGEHCNSHAAKKDVEVSPCQLQTGTKRKRSMLTLETKLEIIEKLKNGEKVTKLAKEYGLGKATVSDIKRQEDKITSFISKNSCGWEVEKRKTMRNPQEIYVEKALQMWLNRERINDNIITGPKLVEKAIWFHKQLYRNENSSFKASSGWLHRFKLRSGILSPKSDKEIRSKRIGNKQNANVIPNINLHLEALRKHIRDGMLSPEHIFTVSFNRICWQALPFKSKATQEFMYSKSYLTVITCVNADGSCKLRPCLVGKAEFDKTTFKINVERLPFRYYYNRNIWLDHEFLRNWFEDEFVFHLKSIYQKALLLVDDHQIYLNQRQLTCEDGRYVCMSINSKVNFLTYPVNSFLFNVLKFKYRIKLVEFLLTSQINKRPSPNSTNFKKVYVKDAGYLFSEAWDSVRCDAVKEFWLQTFYLLTSLDFDETLLAKVTEINDEKYVDGEKHNKDNLMKTLIAYDNSITKDDFDIWIALDDERKEISNTMSDEDIVDYIRRDLTNSESDDECEIFDDSSAVPNSNEAYKCFQKCLLWLECQNDCEPAQLQFLWKLQQFASQKK